MFKNVDSLAILTAIVTGIAMAALIWLSVMFARHRKRNKVVVMLSHGMKAAQQAAEEAEAINLELKVALARAQKEVDKAVGDYEEYLKQFKIQHEELVFQDELGHGRVCRVSISCRSALFRLLDF